MKHGGSLNLGCPLMKHRGRQRDFSFNLGMVRWSRCFSFINNFHRNQNHSRVRPRTMLPTKFKTEGKHPAGDKHRKSQRPLTLWVDLASSYIFFRLYFTCQLECKFWNDNRRRGFSRAWWELSTPQCMIQWTELVSLTLNLKTVCW